MSIYHGEFHGIGYKHMVQQIENEQTMYIIANKLLSCRGSQKVIAQCKTLAVKET